LLIAFLANARDMARVLPRRGRTRHATPDLRTLPSFYSPPCACHIPTCLILITATPSTTAWTGPLPRRSSCTATVAEYLHERATGHTSMDGVTVAHAPPRACCRRHSIISASVSSRCLPPSIPLCLLSFLLLPAILLRLRISARGLFLGLPIFLKRAEKTRKERKIPFYSAYLILCRATAARHAFYRRYKTAWDGLSCCLAALQNTCLHPPWTHASLPLRPYASRRA